METQDVLKETTADYVEAAAEKIRKLGVKARMAVRTGRPAEEIAIEARKRKADLIILGSHGGSTVEAAVLGSVAYAVIHKNSSIPVWGVTQSGNPPP